MIVVSLGMVPQAGVAVAAGTLSVTGFSPTSGPVGTVIKLTGTGFNTSDIVQFNGTRAGVTRVNSAETTLTTSVPPFATSGEITVMDPASGQTAGLPNTPFTVTPGLSASPNHVWAGGQYSLAGSALTPGQVEAIYFGKVRVGVAQTDASGDFQSRALTVPWSARSGKTTTSIQDVTYGKVVTAIYILGDWPQFGHDASRSEDQTYEVSVSPASAPKLTSKWSYNITDGCAPPSVCTTITPTQPVVANDIAYFSDSEAGSSSTADFLYAVNVSTGVTVWQSQASSTPVSPAFDAGRLFVEVQSFFTVALNASTGSVIWSAPLGCKGDSPTVTGGVVYVACSNGAIYALSESTGSVLWGSSAGTQALTSAAVAGGTVLVGSLDGHLYAVTTSTGAPLWQYTTGGAITNGPLVSGSDVYVGSNDKNEYAIDLATGTKAWSYGSATGEGAPIAAAVAKGLLVVEYTVFCGFFNAYIMQAFDASTGTVVWTTNTCRSAATLAIANGVVVDGVYVFDASSGSQVRQLPYAGFYQTPPIGSIISDGLVTVAYPSAGPSGGVNTATVEAFG